jgi:hypothetical protein
VSPRTHLSHASFLARLNKRRSTSYTEITSLVHRCTFLTEASHQLSSDSVSCTGELSFRQIWNFAKMVISTIDPNSPDFQDFIFFQIIRFFTFP